jgi:hypothetical protein
MTAKTVSVEKCASGLAGDGSMGACQEKGRATKGQSCGPESPQRRAKAEAYWRNLNQRRKAPGHCGRCGRPWTGLSRQCDRCHDYGKRKRQARKVKPVTVDTAALEALTRRIGFLEIAFARLQIANATAYRRGWDKGHRRGRGQRARNYEGLCGEHSEHRADCKTSRAELAQLCHAYTDKKD